MSGSPPTPAAVEPAARADPRLYWRAVVNGNRRPGDGQIDGGVAWHLAGCAAPASAASHCPEGQLLLSSTRDPDGHCLIDGVCPRHHADSGATAPDGSGSARAAEGRGGQTAAT